MNEKNAFLEFSPPGHYYSPIPDINEVEEEKRTIFEIIHKSEIKGIDFKVRKQKNLFKKFIKFFNEQPFTETETSQNRYYFNNDCFGYGDALVLYSMIRHLKPKNIIEVGSGFSSAVMLDTNEKFLKQKTALTFIEPYPDRLNKLIKARDKNNSEITIYTQKLQDTDLSIFSKLKRNDILFIDSSHVSKIGSDVNTILFKILPNLHKGVYIHFHDIFYPFEYPYSWIKDGRAWNESYILRAFLSFNKHFEIVFFNNFMHAFKSDFLSKNSSLFMKNSGGSLWLKKVA